MYGFRICTFSAARSYLMNFGNKAKQHQIFFKHHAWNLKFIRNYGLYFIITITLLNNVKFKQVKFNYPKYDALQQNTVVCSYFM